MSSRAERLLAIIARSAPPHERLYGTWLTPTEEQNRARVDRVAARWRKAAGPYGGDERAVLAVRVSGELPPWAAAFVELLSDADFFAPARRFAASLHATASAQEDLVGLFRSRVEAIFAPTLEYERQLAAAAAALGGAAAGSDDGLERFERFPVLAWLLGTAFTQWRTIVGELFARLAADLPELGRVAAFRGDAGDVHGGGRAVALLAFENGEGIAYKPKDLRCAAAFNDLIAFIEPSLRTRRIVVRDGYGWEEMIPHRPCTDAADVALFYRRFGMLVRLLQLVEGRDFWLDNLIADGAQPVFIDLETIMQPRVRREGLSAAEAVARHRLGETVVESCTIAMATPIDIGVSAEDLGALAQPRAYLTPFRRDGKQVTWSHHQHAPLLNGAAADPAAYLEEIVDGYRHMQTRLRALGGALLADGSPLLRLRDVPVRFIHLDTWSYYKLLHRSYGPALLVDGVQREIALQGLAGQTDDEQEVAIARAEAEALRQMDVPLFLSIPATNSVVTPRGTAVESYFDGTAWSRAERRVREIEDFPLEEEIDILRACFSTVYPTRAPAQHDEGAWLEEALRIGDGILADAFARDGELAVIGIAYHPHIDLLGVEVLHADLLTGSCGVALLFAELYAATGLARFQTAARGALRATIRAAGNAAQQWSGVSQAGAPLYCGALLGIGAHLFTLRACADLLSDADLEDLADAHAASIPFDTLLERCSTDFVAGTTGLLLALGDAPALAAALASRRPFAPPRFPQRRRVLDVVPDATAALALASVRMGREAEAFDLDTVGNLRAALEIAPFSAEAIVRARAIEHFDIALDVFAVTGDVQDRDRAARLMRSAPRPLRYDLSSLWGGVARARALLRLSGAQLASIATLRPRGAHAPIATAERRVSRSF